MRRNAPCGDSCHYPLPFTNRFLWSGMKAMTAQRCRAEIFRVRNIFFFPEALRGVKSYFFSLYHLQIVLLTNANTKIHYFYPNNDFDGDLTCVRGMKAPAVPCRATCVCSSLPYFFNSRLLEHLSWVHFY